MANAEQFYVDPSALLKLYLHEPESRAMAQWRSKLSGPLPITLHGRVEIANGIALAAHRGLITSAAFQAALQDFDSDVEEGRYRVADLLWRAVLKRAAELSREHTAKLGTRSLDVLHVASALELGLKRFVTFDERQRQLAVAVGLKAVAPGT